MARDCRPMFAVAAGKGKGLVVTALQMVASIAV